MPGPAAQSLLEAWLPEANSVFAHMDAKLGRIESALTGRAALEEDIPILPEEELVLLEDEAVATFEETPPLPDWMMDSGVTVDGDASASGLWDDEGLVLVGDPAALPQTGDVPETQFDPKAVEEADFDIDVDEESAYWAESPPGQSWAEAIPTEVLPQPAEADLYPTAEPDVLIEEEVDPVEAMPESLELLAALDSAFDPGHLAAIIEDQLSDLDSVLGPLAGGPPSLLPAPAPMMGEDPYATTQLYLGYAIYGAPWEVGGFREYSGFDPEDRTEVRLRVLAPSADSAGLEWDQRARLLDREIELAGQLWHPTLPHLVESGEEGEVSFAVYEAQDGHPLRSFAATWVAADRDWYARRVGRSLAEGLQYMHDRGFVCCDLAVDKVVVTSDLGCRLIDLSRSIELGDDPHPLLADGSVMLAPEILEGGSLSPASDQFSLGALLYEVLKGAPPWPGTEPDEEPPPPLEGVNTVLAEIVMRMLDRHPAGRFDSMDAVARELSRVSVRTRRERDEQSPEEGWARAFGDAIEPAGDEGGLADSGIDPFGAALDSSADEGGLADSGVDPFGAALAAEPPTEDAAPALAPFGEPRVSTPLADDDDVDELSDAEMIELSADEIEPLESQPPPRPASPPPGRASPPRPKYASPPPEAKETSAFKGRQRQFSALLREARKPKPDEAPPEPKAATRPQRDALPPPEPKTSPSTGAERARSLSSSSRSSPGLGRDEAPPSKPKAGVEREAAPVSRLKVSVEREAASPSRPEPKVSASAGVGRDALPPSELTKAKPTPSTRTARLGVSRDLERDTLPPPMPTTKPGASRDLERDTLPPPRLGVSHDLERDTLPPPSSTPTPGASSDSKRSSFSPGAVRPAPAGPQRPTPVATSAPKPALSRPSRPARTKPSLSKPSTPPSPKAPLSRPSTSPSSKPSRLSISRWSKTVQPEAAKPPSDEEDASPPSVELGSGDLIPVPPFPRAQDVKPLTRLGLERRPERRSGLIDRERRKQEEEEPPTDEIDLGEAASRRASGEPPEGEG